MANCVAFREDIEAFALGVLNEPEARPLEVHLATCPECAAVLHSYESTIDHLALAAPARRAPAALKGRILDALAGEDQASPPPVRQRAFVVGRWSGLAAAAVVVLAIGALVWAAILSGQLSSVRSDNNRLSAALDRDSLQLAALQGLQAQLQTAQARLDQQTTLIDLAFDPDTINSQMQGTALAPEARCHYVWSTYQSIGGLSCQNLPSPGASGSYAMWITKGGQTLSAGSFQPLPDGSASALVKLPAAAPSGPATNMWVTLEPSSSVSTPGSQVVLVRAQAQPQ